MELSKLAFDPYRCRQQEDNMGCAALQALRAACPHNVEVRLVQAGHCPHDEAPALVNAALLDFVSSRVEAGKVKRTVVLS